MHSQAPIPNQTKPKVVYIDNSVNSGYLDIAYHYLPKANEGGEPILKVKIPGDGNCGFYSIALGLMNLIVQDKLVLSDQAYAELLAYLVKDTQDRVVRERAQYYKDGIPLDDKRVRLEKCLPSLDRIVRALKEKRLDSFGQFKRFLLNYNNYYDILSLIIFMGPALRALSISLLDKYPSISQIEGISILEAEPRDGKDAPFAQLNLLADFFDFHLVGYNAEHIRLGSSYGEPAPNQTIIPIQEKPQTSSQTQSVLDSNHGELLATQAMVPGQMGAHTSSQAAPADEEEEEEEKDNAPSAPAHLELDPLLGLAFNNKNKASTSVSAALSSAPSLKNEEKESTDRPLRLDTKPTISIAYGNRPGHWDLLLSMSAYLSPPFYFGFDYIGVDFEKEALLAKQKMPPELAATQVSLAHEKKRMQQFRQEVIKLKIAVSALSNNKEYETGKRLIQVLETNVNTLFTPKNASPEDLKAQHNAFIICSKTVRKAHEEFKKTNRSIANILANIGLFIATLGVGYLVVGAIHYYATGRVGFFNKPPAILRNELPAFSSKLVELHKERGSLPSKIQELNETPAETVEDLPPLPAVKEWSKIKI